MNILSFPLIQGNNSYTNDWHCWSQFLELDLIYGLAVGCPTWHLQ